MSPSKILGVDDEADFEALISQRFRHQIRDREVSFRFAHRGEEALTMLEADPDIELMPLDISMPVMDGLTLLQHSRDRQSAVKAIIVSAYGDTTNLRTAMEVTSETTRLMPSLISRRQSDRLRLSVCRGTL